MGNTPQGYLYDGIDHPGPPPFSNSWKKTGPLTYEAMMKISGKPHMTNTYVVSADGNTMTRTNVVVETGGWETSVYRRTGAAADPDLLIGTWKRDPNSVKGDNKERLIIEQIGDTITLSNGIPGRATPEFTGRADGTDYPWVQDPSDVTLANRLGASGATTMSVELLDDHSFVFYHKRGGQPAISLTYVLSADGKTLKTTLTITSKIVRELSGITTPQTLVTVYDKQ